NSLSICLSNTSSLLSKTRRDCDDGIALPDVPVCHGFGGVAAERLSVEALLLRVGDCLGAQVVEVGIRHRLAVHPGLAHSPGPHVPHRPVGIGPAASSDAE